MAGSTHALSAEQCGRVEPFWVALGWVQWQGMPEPTRQMNIEYRQCSRRALRCVRNGFVVSLCEVHAYAPLRVSTATEPK